MRIRDDVGKFLNDLYGYFEKICYSATDLKTFIENDIKIFDANTTDRILERKMVLPYSWENYELSDIDIYYEERMLPFCSMLDLFGIRNEIPPVRSGDKGLIVVYRFTVFDVLGGVMDTVTGFRVFIEDKNHMKKDRRIIVYG